MSRDPAAAFGSAALTMAAGHAGQVEKGLRLLGEALAACETSARGDLLTEAYRLQGELILRRPSRRWPRRKPAFIRLSPWHTASRLHPGSCGPR
jgi:hypothetical protein